jgi:hypothetical protein
VHVDQTVTGCTEDDERDGCAGLEERHEADPHGYFEWWGGCDYCGISQQQRPPLGHRNSQASRLPMR